MSLQMFFDKNDITASEFKQLKFDAARNELDGTTQKEASAKIREAMFSVLGIETEKPSKKEIRRAYKRHKLDVFEVIEDVVEDMLVSGWQESEFFDKFVEYRSIALGDRNDFWTPEEVYLSVNRMSGNHHDVSIQRLGEGESFTVPVTTYVAAVGTDIELFLLARRDWNELVDAIYKAFDKKVKDTIYAEVINVGDKLPANDMYNKTLTLGSATKEIFDQLIEDVATANNDVDVIVMGTRTAISQVAKLTDIDWSENMKDEMNKTGRVGYYEGTALIEIPQRFAPGDPTTKLIKTDRLLILPNNIDKFVKFVDEGDAEILEITEKGERMDDSMKFEYQRTMGVATQVGKYFGVVKLTTAPVEPGSPESP